MAMRDEMEVGRGYASRRVEGKPGHDEMQGVQCISARVVFMVPRVASEGFVHELIGDRVELKHSVNVAVGGEHEGGRAGAARDGHSPEFGAATSSGFRTTARVKTLAHTLSTVHAQSVGSHCPGGAPHPHNGGTSNANL